MQRMVLFFVLLCVGCAFRQPSSSVQRADCPFPTLQQLPCAEAVTAVGELQSVTDRVRTLMTYAPPVWVRLMPGPVSGRHHYYLAGEPQALHLRVSESFLRQVNRLEAVERYVCGWILSQRGDGDLEDLDVRRCVLMSALAAGETERVRWLLRTLPPAGERPVLRQDLRQSPQQGCGVPCAT
jgi:hypothetical protein